MRKSILLVLGLASVILLASPAFAAEAATDAAAQAAAVEAAPEVAAEALAAAEQEAPPTDNLEFVSGEISAVDEAAKSVTIKLYGEAEGEAERILTVKVDETTDITDGEKDRDVKSLAVGTEVDVEFDPATNKSTYIFVY